MNLKSVSLIGTMALGAAAMAQVNVDGIKGSEWNGVAAAHVTHSDVGPYGQLGTSSFPTTDGASYDVYVRGDANYFYGLFTATDNFDTSPGSFANVYLDLNPPVGDGADLGIEVTNQRSFVAGGNGTYYALGSNLSQATTANSVEFAIKWSYLMDSSKPELAGYVVPAGGQVVLRFAQAFGYAPGGGPTYGDNRLGSAIAPQAVPEPASMAALGLGALGLLRRRRASK